MGYTLADMKGAGYRLEELKMAGFLKGDIVIQVCGGSMLSEELFKQFCEKNGVEI